MLPWSVIPRAGWPSATAACTRSFTRAAPSSIENSVWVCRCVNDRVRQRAGAFLGISSAARPTPRVLHRVWTSYSGVIPTIARRDSARGCCRSGLVGGGCPGPERPGRGRRVRGRCPADPRRGIASLGQRPLAHLVELGPGRHLLGHQGGLDPVEQALQPSDQLGVGDPQLGIRGRRRCRRGSRPGPARRPGRARGRRPARGSTARRSRGAGPGWPRPRGAWRTSSSSCLTIEPMRSSLAGCSIDSVLAVLGLGRGRRCRRSLGIGPCRGAVDHLGTERRVVGRLGRSGCRCPWSDAPTSGQCHQGDQHLVAGQRAVAAARAGSPRCRPGRRRRWGRGGAGPRRPAG